MTTSQAPGEETAGGTGPTGSSAEPPTEPPTDPRTGRSSARPSAWALAGVLAGVAGLATSYFLAMVMTIRDDPVVAVADLVIRWTPGALAERAIGVLGHADKPVLVGGVLALVGAVFAGTGLLARRSGWAPVPVLVVLAAIGGFAVGSLHGARAADQAPVVLGLITWLVCLPLLTAPLRRGATREQLAVAAQRRPGAIRVAAGLRTRRSFLVRAGLVTGAALALGALGRSIGAGRRHVAETRRLLRLSGVSTPVVPRAAVLDVDGISPWMTPVDDFYLVHTAIVVPAIEPADWRLRIHGMVDREMEISYGDLLRRRLTEGWITLNCVSNPVGGNLIGNAWWSGVPLADLLAEAGVHPDADAVLQTSQDGWTCGTPVEALTDGRRAMLAVGMNGKPLPIEHGFPVRTLVPGLYGYVSACKWVVDLEVTRFDQISAYWTERGWGERGPVKMSSRIEVPRSGTDVAAGAVRLGGTAWAQHIGIDAVEVAVDGGDWQPAEVSRPGTRDTWVQWTTTVDVEPGDHSVRVRATDREGTVQTGVERDVLPDGATGWHTIGFTATEG